MNAVVTVAICCGLCGLSVGLGARFPVLGQRNPARIASGFGGTFNLIASMLFVLTVMAGVGYLSLAEVRSMTVMSQGLSNQSWLIVAGILALAGVTAVVPMFVGTRYFEKLDY
jgi:ABC-2 type transport system permease protein